MSLTRLRLRSPRFLPAFLWHSTKAAQQLRRAPGCRGLRLLLDRRLTFWTATAWDDEASLFDYERSGAHRAAMPRLGHWCDEAAVARWRGPVAARGDRTSAHARLVAEGRPSRLTRPNARHLARDWPAPRLGRFDAVAIPLRGRA